MATGPTHASTHDGEAATRGKARLPWPSCTSRVSEHKAVTPTVPPYGNAPGAAPPAALSGEGHPVGCSMDLRRARGHHTGAGAMIAPSSGHRGPRGKHRWGGRGQRGK